MHKTPTALAVSLGMALAAPQLAEAAGTDDAATPIARGFTAAPGGNGAHISFTVRGQGLDVTDVDVDYLPGIGLNRLEAATEGFEISFLQDGETRVLRKGPVSGPIRATQHWSLDQSIDEGKFCGRVKTEGVWSNYVCDDISASQPTSTADSVKFFTAKTLYFLWIFGVPVLVVLGIAWLIIRMLKR